MAGPDPTSGAAVVAMPGGELVVPALAASLVAVLVARPPAPRAGRVRSRLRHRPRLPPRLARTGTTGAGQRLAALLPGVDAEVAGRAWAGTALGGPVVLLVAGGPLHALLAAALIGGAPLAADRLARRRLDDRLDGQVPDALARVAASLRAGSSLAGALTEAAAATPPPLGPQLKALVDEAATGRQLAQVLSRWADGAPDAAPGVALAGTALALGAEAGGAVAQAVDGVAATLRDRRRVQAEATALATQARASAVLIGLAPLGFAALLTASDPEAARFLLGTPLGLACLAGGLALEAAGAAWMSRITRSVR